MTTALFLTAAAAAPTADAPAALVKLVEPWATFYADSKLVATLILFGHIAALLFAGGLAVTLDCGTLRAIRMPDLRPRQLDDLGASHRIVIAGLALSAVTGVLMFTADLEAYFVSPVYWTKMTLIVLLLANGYRMTRAEAALRAGATNVDAQWRRLRFAAVASLVLWFAIALAGVALVNAA